MVTVGNRRENQETNKEQNQEKQTKNKSRTRVNWINDDVGKEISVTTDPSPETEPS